MQIFQKIIFTITLFLTFLGYAQFKYEINGGHSNVGFSVKWNDLAIRTGEFKAFGGELNTLKDSDLTGAYVSLKINSNSIDVIADHLADKLKGDEFLDAAKFPQITFTCSGLKLISPNNYSANGKLTVKGISKDVEFMVEDFGRKDDGKYGAIKVIGAISRKDFAILGGGDSLGDKITITSFFEINKKDKKD